MNSILQVTKSQPLYSSRSKKVYGFDEERVLVVMSDRLESSTARLERDVPGSAKIRLDVHQMAVSALAPPDFPFVFIERVNDEAYIARRYDDNPFEAIVKNCAIGSTLRRYPGLFEQMVPFDPPIVEFFCRKSSVHAPIAKGYVKATGTDADVYESIALELNEAISNWIKPLNLLDLCVLYGTDCDGQLVITSELSIDNMRIRDKKGISYDKDVFRQGKDDSEILNRWTELIRLLTQNGL